MPYRHYSSDPDARVYHLYSRGNEKRPIFLKTGDYVRFLNRFEQYFKISGLLVHCFVLMPNHFHVVVESADPALITKTVHKLLTSYSMYFNRRYNRVGHLFQGPFKAKAILDDSYLIQVSSYIHRNPEKIGYEAESYPWSSYRTYVRETSPFISTERILGYFKSDRNAYRAYVQGQASGVRRPRPGLGAPV